MNFTRRSFFKRLGMLAALPVAAKVAKVLPEPEAKSAKFKSYLPGLPSYYDDLNCVNLRKNLERLAKYHGSLGGQGIRKEPKWLIVHPTKA